MNNHVGNSAEFNRTHTKVKSTASQYTLSDDDVKAIINATKTTRNKLIIELLAFTGCRRSELVLLRIMDIDIDRDMIMMPTVKQEQRDKDEPKLSKAERIRIAYKHSRKIPILNDDLKRDLTGYKEILSSKRNITPTSRLIQSRESESMTLSMINIIVAVASKNAGILSPNPDRKQVHPHLFRHTFVRYARKKGVDYKVIQRIVGHANISTTMDMYGEPSWDDKKDELNKMKDFGL